MNITEQDRCCYPNCTREGWLTFRGRPQNRYCAQHFEELAPRVRQLNEEAARARRRARQEWWERRCEDEDNTPARQAPEL